MKIENCARCNGTHDLEFQELERPHDPEGPETYTHWAMCPELEEPILTFEHEEANPQHVADQLNEYLEDDDVEVDITYESVRAEEVQKGDLIRICRDNGVTDVWGVVGKAFDDGVILVRAGRGDDIREFKSYLSTLESIYRVDSVEMTRDNLTWTWEPSDV
ncbi:MAG: hypothetical protein ABEN55_03990 [Bradymonadaceae bacterium]